VFHLCLNPLLHSSIQNESIMKGKNFSCNNATGKRKKSDFYETPYSLTRLLLKDNSFKYDFNDKRLTILEPACGNGAISKVLKKKLDSKIVEYDIQQGRDFLKEKNKYDRIITNPPFSLAYEFIQKAKEVSKQFCFLLPLSYLHGKERHDKIYCDVKYPLRHIFIFTRYPMLGDKLRKDGKHRTGMMVYAWFWWAEAHYFDNQTSISWLDNDPYVLRKR